MNDPGVVEVWVDKDLCTETACASGSVLSDGLAVDPRGHGASSGAGWSSADRSLSGADIERRGAEVRSTTDGASWAA
jgi:hypothetical protein